MTERPDLPGTLLFDLIAVRLQQLLHFGVDDKHAIGRGTIAVVIVFMVAFGGIEVGKGRNFGDNRFLVEARFLRCLLRSLRDPFLLFVMLEDGRTVLRSNVIPLLIERCRVVQMPEYVEQGIE